MAREGLMDDSGYRLMECEEDCAECSNTRCAQYRDGEESEEE